VGGGFEFDRVAEGVEPTHQGPLEAFRLQVAEVVGAEFAVRNRVLQQGYHDLNCNGSQEAGERAASDASGAEGATHPARSGRHASWVAVDTMENI
jgi:hypothetical protein